jgi:hypothetical protein
MTLTLTLRTIAIAMTLAGASAWSGLAQQPPPAHPSHHPRTPDLTPAVPELPGQDAFGAIQEIVRILEADPATDWSKVDVDALREHLIDMSELTLHAKVDRQPIEGGLRMEVTGDGRTLAAIQRMVPAHARQIDGTQGWTVKADRSPRGVVWIVTSTDPIQTAKIRGLGFIGLMSLGAHHQRHHLAIAKGEPVH